MNLFREVIEAIIEKVEGSRSVLIVGIDGIVIDRINKDETVDEQISYELVAAEYTSLLKTAVRTAEDVEIGLLQELTVFTEYFQFLIKMLTEEYFVMCILSADGNFGRARYELKKAKLILQKEFEI